ncbi:hypothetical protein GCM10010495_24730 [Kitasatospora herbaricolor]|nr:hypothetical protein GCM10010495_24730 [Kitasatospora herbaricolor]
MLRAVDGRAAGVVAAKLMDSLPFLLLGCGRPRTGEGTRPEGVSTIVRVRGRPVFGGTA